MTMGRLATALVTIWLVVVPVLAQQPPANPPSGYVPVSDDAIAAEQMPAAPLLVAAYVFFLVAVIFYLWTIWRRLGRVEADMRTLEQRTRSGAR